MLKKHLNIGGLVPQRLANGERPESPSEVLLDLGVVLLVAAATAVGLLFNWSARPPGSTEEESTNTEVSLADIKRSPKPGNAAISDLAGLVEQIGSDFESHEFTFEVVGGATRSGAVIAATAEVLAAWSAKDSGAEIAGVHMPSAVLVWCNLQLRDGEPLWSLILFEDFHPICEYPGPAARLLPTGPIWTWRNRLSRWNGLSAVVVGFFARKPTVDEVRYVFNQWGEETPGSLFPLRVDDRELDANDDLLPLRPHLHAEAWERRIGPLSELP